MAGDEVGWSCLRCPISVQSCIVDIGLSINLYLHATEINDDDNNDDGNDDDDNATPTYQPTYLSSFPSRHQTTLVAATASKTKHIAKPAWMALA